MFIHRISRLYFSRFVPVFYSLRSRRKKGKGVGEEEENSGKKRRIREGGGGGKGTPATKTPIGSFLRSLAAAKF